MFGANPVRHQWLRPDGMLAVQAIFPTIQGEGPLAGRPAIFVRLAGCNLRCWFCDTDFESNIANEITPAQILAQIDALRARCETCLVVITGGEPLRQNILPLLDLLNRAELHAQIETAGTLWIDGLDEFLEQGSAMLVCSPKTPSIHLEIEAHCEHYKYIIDVDERQCPVDGLPLATTQRRAHDAAGPYARPVARPRSKEATIWVQPCDRGEPLRNRIAQEYCAVLAMKYGYRLSLQLHKILNLE